MTKPQILNKSQKIKKGKVNRTYMDNRTMSNMRECNNKTNHKIILKNNKNKQENQYKNDVNGIIL